MDSIDKLALTCKQLYDVRIVEQRQEIEKLKSQLQDRPEYDERKIIRMWKKSDLEYSFHNGVLLIFESWTNLIDIAPTSEDWNFLPCTTPDYIWYATSRDMIEYPYLWAFPSFEVKDKCIKSLHEALIVWKEHLKSTKNIPGELIIIK